MSYVYITAIEGSEACCRSANTAKDAVSQADLDRFWSKVDRRLPTECWLWTGSLIGRAGWEYGQFAYRGLDVKRYAHRFAYIAAYGPIPKGSVVCHRCDVTRCCNPAHLFVGSQSDNLKDAAAKGRFHVPRPRHHRRKLSDEQVQEIRSLASVGMRQCDLARKFGVTRICIYQIVAGLRRVYTAPQLQVRNEQAS